MKKHLNSPEPEIDNYQLQEQVISLGGALLNTQYILAQLQEMVLEMMKREKLMFTVNHN